MLILKKEDIQKVFTMDDAIKASKEAYRLYSQHKTFTPLRTNITVDGGQGQSLYMPAYAETLDAIGVKIVGVFPKNDAIGKPTVPAMMLLQDGKTGEVIAMLEGTYLTQLRTGALQGAATDLLARPDAKTALLFGTGGQAGAQLEAMLAVRPLKEIYVYGLNLERTQQFVERMQKDFAKHDVKITAITDPQEKIAQADIITTITTSKTPVFDGNLVRKGTHVNGIGSYTPDMQELPASIMEKAQKIVFDTKDGVLAEAGDILTPLKKGQIKQEAFSELGEVILGHAQGRESTEEITVFKAVGSAVFDLVTAQAIYQAALKAGVGSTFNWD